MISITLLFTSINFGQSLGFTNMFIVMSFIISLILFAIFIRVEKNSDNPMLDINDTTADIALDIIDTVFKNLK